MTTTKWKTMKSNLKKVRKYRRYSEDFKKQLVSEYEIGRYSVVELERLHGITNSSIYSWLYKYSTFNKKGYRVVEMKDSSTKKLKDLEKRIKDLEGIIGRKQIRIDYLEKLIELAGDEYDIDLKKNCSTPQSTGSDITKAK